MSADRAAARDIMVDSQVRPSDVPDLAVQDAMRHVARETLLPADKQALAYADTEVEYAPGRWMLRPRDVGKLLHGLHPRSGETALAISSPYAAAVLSAMGLTVTQTDAGETSVPVGAFDVIVCEGALAAPPAAWRAALGPNGRLALVERDGPVGHAMLYLRSGEGAGARVLFDCTPPMMAGFDAAPAFAF
jgi:protein-L-isoaspartate(D-aspartate) O-methyltransferase